MEKKSKKKSRIGKILYRAPRVLAVLFAVFISLFALDVFAEGYNLLETVVALLIHLVPTYLIIAALLVARKNEAVGGVLFIFLGAFYIALGCSRGHYNPATYLLISGPCFLIGMLFLLNRCCDNLFKS